MLALASPICAHAMIPPLITSSGFAPKNPGFQSTRSASLPTCHHNPFHHFGHPLEDQMPPITIFSLSCLSLSSVHVFEIAEKTPDQQLKVT
jgi:hypothetical protein